MGRIWEYLKIHKRYAAFALMLSGVLTEQSSRVAISLAMIGGMVKKDCNDANDEGTYQKSFKTQFSHHLSLHIMINKIFR